MESITGYFNHLLEIISKTEWIIHHELSFRQTDDREAYIRGELYLYGGFVLHAAEYVIIENNEFIKRPKYRYQLQDKENILTARWDNAPHHSEISTYPFHKHCKDGKIISSQEMNIYKLLDESDIIFKSIFQSP